MRVTPVQTLGTLSLVLAVACGFEPSGPAAEYDVDRLVADLEAAGATVTVEHLTGPQIFENAHAVTADGVTFQAYEFSSHAAAAQAAAGVSEDGSTIRSQDLVSHVTWVSDPHFYLRGRLIVTYVGEDGRILSLLEEALGPQFAGR